MSERDAVDWKAPVVAAVLGALAVGAFVVYSIVSAPPDEDFARVDGTTQSGEATLFFVSTDLVATATAPPPTEVAEWVVEGANEFSTGGFQYRGVDSPGNITVAAPPGQSIEATRLVARVADGIEIQEHRVTGLDVDGPILREGVEISLGGVRTLVIDRLSIEGGYGWVAWHTEGDVAVRVDTLVTLGDDTLVPDWSVVPLLNRTGSSRLIPGNTGSSNADPSVLFRISVPTFVSDEVGLPVGSE
ncbi:MAG: hypothetical protein ACR2N7_01455 [Acidimicrobiia bacterium]